MYLTNAALTNLQSCLLRSASGYIHVASKVSAIASLTLWVVPCNLAGDDTMHTSLVAN